MVLAHRVARVLIPAEGHARPDRLHHEQLQNTNAITLELAGMGGEKNHRRIRGIDRVLPTVQKTIPDAEPEPFIAPLS